MAVDFRMTKKGLVLLIENYQTIDSLKQEIMTKFSEADDFFAEGDELSLMLSQDTSKPDDIVKIVSLLGDMGLKVKDILVAGKGMKNEATAQKYDLVREKVTEVRGAQVHKRTLRSGQIVVHNFDVIIFGNINPGAEVIAGGSVIVFGAARGVLRAGYSVGDSSVIAALELNSPLIQIGGLISQDYTRLDVPSVAHIRTGRIVVEPAEEARFESKEGRS
ncbi:MAG TPA: septum site-determining protein MinC [Kosmotogaceae bacterium]|nr:septum site-determining protein MinC [Kosmotogaceae bacterium]